MAVEVFFEGVEPAVPITRQRGQELLGDLHRSGLQPVPYSAPLTGFGCNQAGFGQQGQVFGDGLTRDRKAAGEIRGGGRTS